MSVTYADISSVCTRFAEQGEQKVTTRKIRDVLGRGSLSTISKYRKQWMEASGAAVQLPEVEQPPQRAQRTDNVRTLHVQPCTPPVKQQSKSHRTPLPPVQEPARSLSFYLGVGTVGLLLLVCCVLSYHLQVEVYETLKILPAVDILGVSVVKVTAAVVEALLVVLAAFMFKGKNVAERVSAGLLFLVIGGGTAAMMWHGQEVQSGKAIAAVEDQGKESAAASIEMSNLEDDRKALEAQRSALLSQLDANNDKGFAASGAIGLVNKSLSKLDTLEGKIESIDAKKRALSAVRKEDFLPQKSLIAKTTLFAEMFRLVLLFVTAFLVHVLLARLSIGGGRDKRLVLNRGPDG